MIDSQAEKLHAACDECRTRKLKCSGHHPACSRCEREKIQCYYSPQKPMGRPRKRRRDTTTAQTEPLDQTSAASAESLVYKSPVIDSFEIPAFDELSVPPSFDNFSGFDDFQTNGTFSAALLPSSYLETAMNNGFGHDNTQATNFDANQMHTAIDPSLWDDQQKDHPTPHTFPLNDSEAMLPTPNTGPCTCFSLMYLTVSDLQSITNFSFPAIVPRLRNAATTAHTLIKCPTCPLETFSAIQNVQSLTSLLSSLAERYHKVLIEIEVEAARLEATGQKKPFRVGDNSPQNMHLHTGTLNCPMGFNIEVQPREWKRMCKAALKQEVLGGGQSPMPLVKLLDEFAERQNRWHVDADMMSEERGRMFGHKNGARAPDSAMCLKMVTQVRNMVGNMRWDD